VVQCGRMVMAEANQIEITPEIIYTSEGSLGNQTDRTNAINFIVNKQVVAAEMSGVYGTWCDAKNQDQLRNILELKGDTNYHKPFSSMMNAGDLLPLIDQDKIHPDVLPFLQMRMLCKLLRAGCSM